MPSSYKIYKIPGYFNKGYSGFFYSNNSGLFDGDKTFYELLLIWFNSKFYYG